MFLVIEAILTVPIPELSAALLERRHAQEDVWEEEDALMELANVTKVSLVKIVPHKRWEIEVEMFLKEH